MKKIVLLKTVLFSFFCFSQEIVTNSEGKKIKLNENKTWEFVTNEFSKNDTELTSNDLKDFAGSVSTDLLNSPLKYFKNGEDNLVKVKMKFIAPSDKYKATDLNYINSMYRMSMSWAKMKLKNPYSFEPKEVELSYYSAYDIWWCTIKYLAKNSYGGEVAGSVFFTYPLENISRPYTEDELLEITSKKKKNK